MHDVVIKLITSHKNKYGYCDYIMLSALLLFGGNYAINLKDFTLGRFVQD